MPDGDFVGHEGFRDWYAIARNTFKPGIDHQVEQVAMKETEHGYQVDLRIRVISETFEQSGFKGESVNFLVNEIWQVVLDEKKNVIINDYQVVPVVS